MERMVIEMMAMIKITILIRGKGGEREGRGRKFTT